MVWTLVVVVSVLHYDFWLWHDRTLLFGFLPIGLAYHAAISLAAGGVWALVVHYAWPDHLETWASEAETPSEAGSRSAEDRH